MSFWVISGISIYIWYKEYSKSNSKCNGKSNAKKTGQAGQAAKPEPHMTVDVVVVEHAKHNVVDCDENWEEKIDKITCNNLK